MTSLELLSRVRPKRYKTFLKKMGSLLVEAVATPVRCGEGDEEDDDGDGACLMAVDLKASVAQG